MYTLYFRNPDTRVFESVNAKIIFDPMDGRTYIIKTDDYLRKNRIYLD